MSIKLGIFEIGQEVKLKADIGKPYSRGTGTVVEIGSGRNDGRIRVRWYEGTKDEKRTWIKKDGLVQVVRAGEDPFPEPVAL